MIRRRFARRSGGAACAPAGAPPAGRGNFLNNFTGNITVGNTKDMSSSRIKFDAGARTNWHPHSAPQLLLVEEGRGRLQELGEPIKDVPAGQPVLDQGERAPLARGIAGSVSAAVQRLQRHAGVERESHGRGIHGQDDPSPIKIAFRRTSI